MLHYKACTNYFPVQFCTTQLAQSTSQYNLVLQSLHKALPSTTVYYTACTKRLPSATVYYKACTKLLPSTTLYYKACTRHFPVILCTTKLAQSTSLYHLVLQSLHQALPSTTVYHKACTNYFPVLRCTTKLAQSHSQYYLVLHSLHKALPSTTLYYKACTNYFTVLLYTTKLAQKDYLLGTTKLAQSTSQYYFVLQSLHKALPNTALYYKACTKGLITWYYKACTKHFPVLLRTTKLAQNTFSTTVYHKACTRKTKDPRRDTWHVGAAKLVFRARLPPILTLLARYQIGWNVTKCHACHAKRHDNLLGNLRKGEVLQLPP